MIDMIKTICSEQQQLEASIRRNFEFKIRGNTHAVAIGCYSNKIFITAMGITISDLEIMTETQLHDHMIDFFALCKDRYHQRLNQ